MDNVFYLNNSKNNIKLTLEDLIKQADEGEIVSLAIAAVDREGNSISGYVAEDYIFTLIGSIAAIKQYLINEEVER